MPPKGDDTIVLWPRYFDAALTRAEGRRVPKPLAVAKPDSGWVLAAAKKAGYSAEKEEKAAHPALPYESVGRVLVKAKGRKEEAIVKVAKAMQATAPADPVGRPPHRARRGKR
jgi:signal recognition particle subunit SRP19